MQNEKTIYLKDYTEPNYWISKTHLDIDIYDDHAMVKSQIKFFKNPKTTDHQIELFGENLELQSFTLNEKKVDYTLTEGGLTFTPTQDEFDLETVVKIDPYNNTSCEGLYQSGQILCTQNEAQGFRKITYYLDRPDVMATYSTTISADKKKYPFLLCNGDLVDSGDLPEGRHFCKWFDPHKKPSYLYAVVAGDLAKVSDEFKTKSGKTVNLEFFVDPGNEDKVAHAMESLKKSMKWDEERFSLEYDLKTYMIVAVDSFNMGAMENKGLNIFNSAYTLAKKETATDRDFYNIESVIGHEYFHNWTGNRVTCRDWFQLTLKEGLTVFRDQEFSSDMNSRGVKRIEDVMALRSHQFPEDAGPLSHPIRPSSYIEINNFYTATVYEKGAEVIRMIHTLIGEDNFQKGMKLYFERHDGSAVTTEDFVSAMADASGFDLSHFEKWYSTNGTPQVKVDVTEKSITLQQSIKEKESNLYIPLSLGIYRDQKLIEEKLLILDQPTKTFDLDLKNALFTINRGFSAPVTIRRSDLTHADTFELLTLEEDGFTRFDLLQDLYFEMTLKAIEEHKSSIVSDEIISLFQTIINGSDDNLLKSYMLSFASLSDLCEKLGYQHLDRLHEVHKNFSKEIGIRLYDQLSDGYHTLESDDSYSETNMGKRALKNKLLHYMMASGREEARDICLNQAIHSKNMTDEISAIDLLVECEDTRAKQAVQSFPEKWKHEGLVLQKWFRSMAAAEFDDQAKRVLDLENHTYYQKTVPNFVRSVVGTFCMRNLVSFHKEDGSGYKYVASCVLEVDKMNPQLASRIAKSFSVVTKLTGVRKDNLINELKVLLDQKLSKDTFEVVNMSYQAALN